MAWYLTLRSPDGEPKEYPLKPGKNTLGRQSDSNIFIPDESASRAHAEIELFPEPDRLVLTDLHSTNGTYVNQTRLTEPYPLQPHDRIRIGQCLLQVQPRAGLAQTTVRTPSMTQLLLTRDLLLESLDRYAVLMSTVSERLNSILDLDEALQEVSMQLEHAMGADRCQVVLAEALFQLHNLGFPTTIARQAINQRSAILIPDMSTYTEGPVGHSALLLRVRTVLCVPVLMGSSLLGLIYMYKTQPAAPPFDQHDLQLAIAISHQTALTIQRARLLNQMRDEQNMRQLLQRFLSPPEAEYLLQAYQQSGSLPGMTEQTLTMLFSDICASTALAERLGAARFGEILSSYYQRMTEVIFAEGGMVDKYLGDGIMAVFGAPRPLPDAPERAVRAAQHMLRLAGTIDPAGEEKITIGIGINTGAVAAGYVGTEDRLEFAVLGDTVNVAQRLQSLARPNRIFVGPATAARLAGKFNLASAGVVEIKGRSQPIEAHEILP